MVYTKYVFEKFVVYFITYRCMFLKVCDIVHWKYTLVSHWNKTAFTVLVSKYWGPYRGDRYTKH